MTPEEEAISRSTPLCRFDVRPAPAPQAAGAQTAPIDPDGAAFVEAALGDAENPVVMFALEWCEFCWAVRKLFNAYGIPYRSIDLDSVAFQVDDLGGRIRRALGARIGTPTIPQVFIAGELIGGCTEVFEAMESGEVQRRLKAAGVAFNEGAQVEHASLLPKWLKLKRA
jgi:cysteine synthase A